MKRWNILVSAPYFQPVIENYREALESRGANLIIPKVLERLSEQELLTLVGDVDGVIAGDDAFTRAVIQKASPRLKVISKWGTGIDSFDKEACQEFGVTIKNTPNAFTEPVADTVLGYILCFARQLPWMDQQVKGGSWKKIPGRALNETTLGIVGLGNIGLAVAKRAHAFGMRILANDIKPIPESMTNIAGVQMVSLNQLLQESDFVSLNCDLNPTSLHLMNNQNFEKMKNTAVIINTARGSLIDEAFLIKALTEDALAGAALDVFENEPLPSESPLKALPNVMIAPHNSNSSPIAWANVHDNTISNLFDVLEDGL